jgi:hypothetical protein
MFNMCEIVITTTVGTDETLIHGNEKVLLDLTFPNMVAAHTVKLHFYNKGS